MGEIKGLLKNAHLLRCTSNRTAQRILIIRLAIRLLCALYLSIFEQPNEKAFSFIEKWQFFYMMKEEVLKINQAV